MARQSGCNFADVHYPSADALPSGHFAPRQEVNWVRLAGNSLQANRAQVSFFDFESAFQQRAEWIVSGPCFEETESVKATIRRPFHKGHHIDTVTKRANISIFCMMFFWPSFLTFSMNPGSICSLKKVQHDTCAPIHRTSKSRVATLFEGCIHVNVDMISQ